LRALASAHRFLGRVESGEDLLRQRVVVARANHTDDPDALIVSLEELANSLMIHYSTSARDWLNRAQIAAPLLREALTLARDRPGECEEAEARLLALLADALRELGKVDLAVVHASESVELFRSHPEWNLTKRAHAFTVLSGAYQAAGQLDMTVQVRQEEMDFLLHIQPKPERLLSQELDSFGLFLLTHDRFAHAEDLYRECVPLREKLYSQDSWGYWRAVSARSALGHALVGQVEERLQTDRLAALAMLREAGPLIVESAEWLMANPERIRFHWRHRRLAEAIERVALLYETWETVEPGRGHAASAVSWRQKLEDHAALIDASELGASP
jgi:hypothetical protein